MSFSDMYTIPSSMCLFLILAVAVRRGGCSDEGFRSRRSTSSDSGQLSLIVVAAAVAVAASSVKSDH